MPTAGPQPTGCSGSPVKATTAVGRADSPQHLDAQAQASGRARAAPPAAPPGRGAATTTPAPRRPSRARGAGSDAGAASVPTSASSAACRALAAATASGGPSQPGIPITTASRSRPAAQRATACPPSDSPATARADTAATTVARSATCASKTQQRFLPDRRAAPVPAQVIGDEAAGQRREHTQGEVGARPRTVGEDRRRGVRIPVFGHRKRDVVHTLECTTARAYGSTLTYRAAQRSQDGSAAPVTGPGTGALRPREGRSHLRR